MEEGHLIPVKNDRVHVGPSLELPLPVRDGGQWRYDEKGSWDAVVLVEDPKVCHRLQGVQQGEHGAFGTGEQRRQAYKISLLLNSTHCLL